MKLIKVFKGYNKLECLKDIVDKEAETTLLHIAARENKHRLLKLLIEEGKLNVNAKDLVRTRVNFNHI